MPKVTVKTTTCKEKFLKTATNERRTRIMEESRRVYNTDCSGQTSIESMPNALYSAEQNQSQGKWYQNMAGMQMRTINPVLAKFEKDQRRRTNFSIATIEQRVKGILNYDDGYSYCIPITEVDYGEIRLIKLEAMNQSGYLIIQWGSVLPIIIVRISELTPTSLYKEFKQKG